MKKVITNKLVISLIIVFCLLVTYSLLRLGFFISNYSYFGSDTSTDIFKAFLGGLRFDVAAIAIINTPVLLLYNLPFYLNNIKWYRIPVYVLFFVINIAAIALNVADFGYFPTIERRLLFEPYTMLPDIMRMIPGLITYHYVLFAVFLASSILFVYLIYKIYLNSLKKLNYETGIAGRIFSLVLLAVLVTTAIRGGFQYKPLRIANAFESDKIGTGYLELNSTYTVIRSYFQPALPKFDFLPQTQAAEIIEKMFRSDSEKMTGKEFPFERFRAGTAGGTKFNVVIFIMESWSASYTGCISGKETRTPFFDSLSVGGLLFTNFYANGQRSIEAVPCILASIPAIYSTSVIGSQSEVNTFRGLGTILKENGYTTSFHHGASTGSMGFDAFSRIAGFTKYYGKETMPGLTDSITDGSWGVCDEPFFLQTEKNITEFSRPFCSVIFSLSSHDPYVIPDYRKKYFEKYKETEFERAVRYSDFSLREFFNAAKKEDWFNNTIFIITADHTLFNSRRDFYSTFHAPLLIYSPSLVRPQIVSSTASHADILPTILDLLNISTVHSSMGRSVLESTQPRYAFLKYASYYCIATDKYVLMDDLENPPSLFDIQSDPSISNNLASSRKDLADDLSLKLQAYLQESTGAIANNKVYKDIRDIPTTGK